MRIAVIGAAGKAGRLIVREAMDRGHAVTAVVRPGSEARVPAGCTILAKNLFAIQESVRRAACIRRTGRRR